MAYCQQVVGGPSAPPRVRAGGMSDSDEEEDDMMFAGVRRKPEETPSPRRSWGRGACATRGTGPAVPRGRGGWRGGGRLGWGRGRPMPAQQSEDHQWVGGYHSNQHQGYHRNQYGYQARGRGTRHNSRNGNSPGNQDGWPLPQQPQQHYNPRLWGRSLSASRSGYQNQSPPKSPGAAADSAEETNRKRVRAEILNQIVPLLSNQPEAGNWAREQAVLLASTWEQDSKGAAKTDDNLKKFPAELKVAFSQCLQLRVNLPSFAFFLLVSSNPDNHFISGKTQGQSICQLFTLHLTNLVKPSKSLVTSPPPLQSLCLHYSLHHQRRDLKLLLSTFLPSPCSIPPSLLASSLQNLCTSQDYSTACQLSLSLSSTLPPPSIHLFLVPLLLQDKLSLIEPLLSAYPPLQHQLLQFLDTFFAPDNHPSQIYQQLLDYSLLHRIPSIKSDKLQHKPLSKLVKRLRTKFNLSFASCPNIGHRQRYGELRHLFTRRYDKHEMSRESFWELIMDLSNNDKTLWRDIVHYYLEYRDYQECARFVADKQFWEVDAVNVEEVRKHLPEEIRREWEEKWRREQDKPEEYWDDDEKDKSVIRSPPRKISREEVVAPAITPLLEGNLEEKQFYKHPLSREKVIIIEDKGSVLELCRKLRNIDKPCLSGLDTEWKPILSKTKGCALLQIAFEEEIYLLDLIQLKQAEGEETLGGKAEGEETCPWRNLRKWYFENDLVLKLGFDLKSDLKMLQETKGDIWGGLGGSWRNMLDLQGIRAHLGEEKLKEGGLTELVAAITGKGLSKEEQMSDWEKRPLREEQLSYAANDAYSLISAYRGMEEICRGRGETMEGVRDKALKQGREQKEGQRKRKVKGYMGMIKWLEGRLGGVVQAEVGKVGEERRLVVDCMVLGLGRLMRSMGCDTVLLEGDGGKRGQMRRLREWEGRKVITRAGVGYHKMREWVEIQGAGGVEGIYGAKEEFVLEQAEETAKWLALSLEETRLFTRCYSCNSNRFICCGVGKIGKLLETGGCHLAPPGMHGKGKRGEGTALPGGGNVGGDLLKKLGEMRFDDQIPFLTPDQLVFKQWTLLPEEVLVIKEGVEGGRGSSCLGVYTPGGVKVQYTRLQVVYGVLDQVFICEGCGKSFWTSKSLEAEQQEKWRLEGIGGNGKVPDKET